MIVCADDYGLSPGVNQGILELVRERRITAVSCMTIYDSCEADLEALRPGRADMDIGLHVVLTRGRPVSSVPGPAGLVNSRGHFHEFPEFVSGCLTGRMSREALSREVRAQLERFVRVMGEYPDFIDGHQHVQQLPGVRDVVIELAREIRRAKPRFYVRLSSPPVRDIFLRGFPARPGLCLGNLAVNWPGRSFRRMLDASGIAHNGHLLGYHAYERAADFPDILRFYLSLRPAANDIFFCHPGYVDDDLRQRDDVVRSRIRVLACLRSPEYLSALNESGVELNRFV
ncbi:MAG: ChbG/HpnK family deacetylase [Candidatus Omnitrophota bacterium]|nr:ChbG/HpnK family deacetylase [Candidatus Omnitrophota bacterium]MDZ4241973.1 ChbG/HpnK family deacetylase [Candidatus Omnitrophota bacterium]